MSENSYSFKILPWDKPKSLENFVPQYTRFYTKKNNSIFIAWRDDVALIFTFQNSSQCLSTQQPFTSQVLSSKGNILNVVAISSYIYFVTSDGLFQILCSNNSEQHKEILKYLGVCESFILIDAFELSPLKKLLAVATMPDGQHSLCQNTFAAVTQMKNCSKIDAELYSVSWVVKSKGECQLQYVLNICDSNALKDGQEKCVCSFLTDRQAQELFRQFKDTEILLVGLRSGQLFCVPFLIASRNYGIKPTARLIYQSLWPIIGLTCPSDGKIIFLFIQGGTVLSISPLPNPPRNDSRTFSLSYNSFSLPYTLNCFSVLKNDLMVVSDGVHTSVVNLIPPDQPDIRSTSLRGVTATSVVPQKNVIVASTFHNVFYLLDPFNLMQSTDSTSSTWTGGSLDVSLQLVQDMKKQTELLSQLKNEAKEEEAIIRALSAVSRATFLTDRFTTTVVVTGTCKYSNAGYPEDYIEDIKTPDSIQQTFQLSVDIRNDSSEDFSPPLWQICLEISNPDGMTLSRNIPLSKTFSQESQFSTTLNLPCEVENFSFPVQVKAALVAELKERHCESQWLKIQLGLAKLDISHFFSVSFQPHASFTKHVDQIAGYINQMHFQSPELDTEKEELKHKASMMSYVIPIPELLRKPNMIIEKLMSNCKHHHQHLEIEKDFYHQNDKTVIWLTLLGKTARLEFRKSCASITISSSNVKMLHSIKLCLANMFCTQNSSVNDTAPDALLIKAKNLDAILETQSLEEPLDSKELLIIYQDLRNSVSSQILRSKML